MFGAQATTGVSCGDLASAFCEVPPRTAAVIEAESEPVVLWRKGWTPWGTPCAVLMVDGLAFAAHATEKHNCPLARLASD
jgi:hypothetical protein